MDVLGGKKGRPFFPTKKFPTIEHREFLDRENFDREKIDREEKGVPFFPIL